MAPSAWCLGKEGVVCIALVLSFLGGWGAEAHVSTRSGISVCWVGGSSPAGGGPKKRAGAPGSRRPLLPGYGSRVVPPSRPAASATMVAGSPHRARRKANVAGNLFVDETCIDCDTCRWMQGDVFVHDGGKSAVARQPETEEERRGAYRAMLACPTSSIRLETADPLVRDALADFPFPVDSERLPGVFHLGFHDENSFGCSPWLVQRPAGNVMMDSPRFHPGLAKALDAKGGVSLMVLSHIDDVGDHQRWKERFPAMKRVMHKSDIREYGDTRNIEVQLETGSADGQIGGFDFWDIAPDLRAVHMPGHSRGSITLLYSGGEEEEGVAFTGDHLALSGRTAALTGFPRYGHDLAMQSESLELLARPDVKFRWILPGHGRLTRFASHEDRAEQIMAAAANTKAGRP